MLGQITECAGTSSATLMGPGDDPHMFQPSSAQMAELAGAGLVVANGLGLESELEGALENARQDGVEVLEVGPEVDPLPWTGLGSTDSASEEAESDPSHEDHGHDDEAQAVAEAEAADNQAPADQAQAADDHSGHAHGTYDPHFWMDTSRMAQAATVIGTALADHTGDTAYAECGKELEQEIDGVDSEVRDLLAAIPEENRVLITEHEALGYFAEAYDFDIAGVVVPGGSTDAEPSSDQVAQLVATIEETGVPVIFSDSAAPSALLDTLSKEAGTEVEIVQLFVENLGPEGSEPRTYQGMMVENATRIAEALA
ncbi:hypothetical protein GCM10022261_09360 [Brevibacterium daeguense]|uniref:Zinc ABC transporter substrate-binding protein n=1 Tax=Brevibacterium daeguense TaxID=909936 RepID=A0ABP8EHI3_9MICO